MVEKEKIEKSEVALREEKVLEFWREKKIFEKTLSKTEGKKEFVFYEGPPTANAKPGIHHLEARAFKDAIPRYKTMRGYHVRRKGGWDTHGLPVELQVEKKLGLDSKKAIEEYGIAKFNQECRKNVWEQIDLWTKFTERIGFWLDQDNPYVTYENNYIESVWNVIKKTNDQKLLYKDYKVVPWCPRCGTVLSSHELAQGYEEVKDLSVYVKFKIKGSVGEKFSQVLGKKNCYILAWTTTPWTLPGNVALAVGKDIDYVKIKIPARPHEGSGAGGGEEFYILAKERLSLVENYEIVLELKGKDLVGLEYEPLFPYLKEQIEQKGESTEKAYQVYSADFVNTEEGTGIVHTAVMYGQDDFELGTQVGLPKHHLVDPEGKFIKGTGFLEGRFVKETDVSTDGKPGKPTLTVDIIEDLKTRNLFFKQENYKHPYPHCWRCKTALIYYARDSWYIRMSDKKIKEKLISENKKINWEPEYTRDGRFGEWLREIKDWAISRERYWGTPLPVWICEKCDNKSVIGGIDDLKKKTKKSNNKYFVMRHGGSESNLKNTISSKFDGVDHLTEKGKKQTLDSIKDFKNKKIDLIISSSFMRTKETAEIVKQELGLSDNQLVFDERLWELNVGVFDGKTWNNYWEVREKGDGYFYKPEGGESHKELKLRISNFLYEIEEKYKDKNILIITHEGPARVLFAGVKGLNDAETVKHLIEDIKNFKNAEIRELDFVPLPHNINYELDLHRPYIDEVKLVCGCGGDLVRTREVMDVWLDSGAMPFAQDHYPSENKKWVEGKGYPADYISEAIDQTRGWFYTLHAVGILMGRGRAYENVICLGHLLDAKGKKMSKSVGNVIDPWEMSDKYGVDTLRLWMYSVNQPGESKNFDEKTVALLQQQFFGLLYNVLAFYELYRDENIETNKQPESKNILDQWILARLNELIKLSTGSLDNYKLLEPTRAIRDFIGDLSTWYLRRSRERIKDANKVISKDAKQTLYFILKTIAKVLAPFAPFSAEDIWLKLRSEKDEESVHLSSWPKAEKINSGIIENMKIVRGIVSLGLEARQRAKIQVRQPLGELKVKGLKLSEEYLELIKDELNVKEVISDSSISNEVELNTEITEELKEEGNYRELVRAIQDMRKKQGLTPSDIILLSIDTDETGKKLVQKIEYDLRKTVLASGVEFKPNNGEEIKVEEMVFKVNFNK